MDKIQVTPTIMKLLLQNAENYATEMAATAAPEQIETVRRRNNLFNKGFELCPNCHQESVQKLETCEFCGRDKFPF